MQQFLLIYIFVILGSLAIASPRSQAYFGMGKQTINIIAHKPLPTDLIGQSQNRIIKILKDNYLNTNPIRYSDLAGIDLENLIKQLTAVKFIYGDRNMYIQFGSCQSRRGMVNSAKNKTVSLSPYFNQLNISLPHFDAWILHESIEALGYFDENYANSIALLWFNNLDDETFHKIVKSDLFEKISDSSQETYCIHSHSPSFLTTKDLKRRPSQDQGGGSTGVGSGGDPWAIELKFQMADLTLEKYINSKQTERDFQIFKNELIRILIVPIIINYGISDTIEDLNQEGRPIDVKLLKEFSTRENISITTMVHRKKTAIEVFYYPYTPSEQYEFIKRLLDKSLQFEAIVKGMHLND